MVKSYLDLSQKGLKYAKCLISNRHTFHKRKPLYVRQTAVDLSVMISCHIDNKSLRHLYDSFLWDNYCTYVQ